MNDPLDDLQFSPFSPIYDQEQQVDEPYVWVKKSTGFKTFSRKALILKAIERRDAMIKDAQKYPISKSWYMERAEVMNKIINRLDKNGK